MLQRFFISIPFYVLLSCTGTGSVTQSPRSDSTRYYLHGLLISGYDPKIEIKFDDDFTYAGMQPFTLNGMAEVQQYYFVKAGSDKRIDALYTVQFESYSPLTRNSYNYDSRDSLVKDKVSFLHSPVFNSPNRVVNDTRQSDVWYRFTFLKAKGYVLPDDVIGHRFIKVIDPRKQKEILIIYNEDLKNTGFTAHQLDEQPEKYQQVSRQLLEKALKGFKILNYKGQ